MKLAVEPFSGWGFYDVRGTGIPPKFKLEVEIEEAGDPFNRVVGQVADREHDYYGLWVRLTPRSGVYTVCCMDAYAARPSYPKADVELIASGMANVEVIRP